MAEDVGERVRPTQIEDELVAAEHRLVAIRGQRPVGMGPVQLAVGVDHLGLDPDAELHAEAGDVLDQRRQTLRVHVGRHDPVAEARRVVAPGTEPSVVEHEPLDADRRGGVGEFAERVVVVAEVDRLPRVQQHRPGRRRVRRAAPHRPMESPRGRREPSGRVHSDHVRRRVRLARLRARSRRGAAARLLARIVDRRPTARPASCGCRSRRDGCRAPRRPTRRIPRRQRTAAVRCSCEVRPRRCSETTAPWSHRERAGWNSRAHRPSKRSSSSAASGNGRLTVNASSEYRRSATFVRVTRTPSTSSTVISVVSARPATSSSASTVTMPSATRCAVGRNRGAQSRPPPRRPASPGRPTKPSACSGTMLTGATVPRALATAGRPSAGSSPSSTAPPPSGWPQCTTVGVGVSRSRR